MKYIERSVRTMESRYISRVLRTVKGIRKKATDNLLRIAINKHLPTGTLISLLYYYIGEMS